MKRGDERVKKRGTYPERVVEFTLVRSLCSPDSFFGRDFQVVLRERLHDEEPCRPARVWPIPEGFDRVETLISYIELM